MIGAFLAPETFPELLHSLNEGGPVTYALLGGIFGAACLDGCETGQRDADSKSQT